MKIIPANKRKIIFLILTIAYLSNIAQTAFEHEAPTLQVGLDALSFGKGTLDAQLVMEIVAEKQKEIAIKSVQNLFLSKMQNAGGAFYSFVDNTIRGIVLTKDLAGVQKIILENTVNIGFTYAFAEFYLRQLQRSGASTQLAHFNNLATHTTFGFSAFSPAALNRGLLSIRSNVANTDDGNIEKDTSATKLIAVLSDMSSEVIRNNIILKNLGVLQVSYSQSYRYMNTYLSLKDDNPTVYGIAEVVYKDMEDHLKIFSNLVGLVHYHLNANSYRLNNTALVANFATTPAMPVLPAILDSLVVRMDKIQSKMYDAFADTTMRRRLQSDLQTISESISYLRKAFDFINANPLTNTSTNLHIAAVYSDIIYTVFADILPKLTQISKWNSSILKETLLLESVLRVIYTFYENDPSNPLNSNFVKNNMNSFLNIISRLYEFDKSNTFSSCVNILSEFEDVFPDSRVKNVLAFTNTYIRDLVHIHKANGNREYISIDIETFLDKLSNVKSDRLYRGGFLFNVGVNTIWFDQKLMLDNGETLKNYSCVSEKIGFRFKIWDRAFWMTRNPGEFYSIGDTKYQKVTAPYEPILSGVNAFIYGSGILYNLANTGTTRDFNAPLLGLGLSAVFFNDLEVSFSVGAPILKDGEIIRIRPDNKEFSILNTYYAFSFDFPFAEYIKRVNQKRKDTQNKKLVANAMNND